MCFTRDTLVATENGQKAIGEIRANDLIRTFDFTTGQWTDAKVVQRHDNIYRGDLITIWAGASRIEVTPHHPFWVVEGKDLTSRPRPQKLAVSEDEGPYLLGRWIDPQELRPGDILITATGKKRRVESVEIRQVDSLAVSNLTIEQHHNFAVGSDSFLVHNAEWCNLLQAKVKKPDDLVVKAYELSAESGKTYFVHAHHIVMKGNFKGARGEAVDKARKILSSFDPPIKLLGTEAELKAAKADELANMCWAINSVEGIHSTEYAKAVADRLEKAAASGDRGVVVQALKDMANILQKGEKFW
jgi:hypothetical protein